MKNLMQYVDVCIGNEEDEELVLGYKPGKVMSFITLDFLLALNPS